MRCKQNGDTLFSKYCFVAAQVGKDVTGFLLHDFKILHCITKEWQSNLDPYVFMYTVMDYTLARINLEQIYTVYIYSTIYKIMETIGYLEWWVKYIRKF